MKTKKMHLKYFLLLSMTFFYMFSLAQSGALDTTFGVSGKMTTSLGTNHCESHSVALQNDGKIILAGHNYTSSTNVFAVVRYKINGTLDNTFGTGGKVTTSIYGQDDQANCVLVQNDGKIVAVGYADSGNFNTDFALVRYNTNGTLDNTFGSGGKVTTSVGTGMNIAYEAAIQNDGKIVVAGSIYNGVLNTIALVRYNTNGSLDNTFGTGGKVTTSIGALEDKAYSVVIENNGKIVIAGQTDNGIETDFLLVRYNSDGTLDNNFGTNGITTTSIGIDEEKANSLAIQNDGKFVIVGTTNTSSSKSSIAVMRYDTSGVLDNNFGNNGIVTTTIGNFSNRAESVIIQSDGKILVGGSFENTINQDFVVLRYNESGSIDSTFHFDGMAITNFYQTDYGLSLAIQNDNKIILAGLVQNGYGHVAFGLARYNNTILPPSSISKMNKNSKFVEIFPNPSSETFEIENLNQQTGTIQIYNMFGTLIYNHCLSINNTKINLSSEPNGIYFINIKSGENFYRQKVIKQ